MAQRGSYYTSTKRVDSFESYHTIAIGSDKWQELIANGETFRFRHTFDNPEHERYSFYPKTVEVTLTCSIDKAMLKKRGKHYYYAHWRDNRLTTKPLKRKYLGRGESITLEKLKKVAKSMLS